MGLGAGVCGPKVALAFVHAERADYVLDNKAFPRRAYLGMSFQFGRGSDIE